MKRSKKYIEVSGKIDKNKYYDLESALALLPQISVSKFEGSAITNIKLNLTKSEEGKPFKGTVTFPYPFGKVKKILIFADGIDIEKAKKAGADYAGLNELIDKIKEGWLDFDIVIATPEVMPKIAVLGKILGTKGLMPNPKNGTVTTDVEKSIKEFKAGKITFKSDKSGNVQSVFGTVNMEITSLKKNLIALIKSILNSAKKNAKGGLKSLSVNPTMGPGIKVEINDLADKL